MRSLLNSLSFIFPLITMTTGLRKARKSAILSLPWRASQLIRANLRAKFIVVIVSLEIALMVTVSVVVERHQRRAILEQTLQRALSLGSSLAALSESYLLTYNFAKLEQAVERVTADEDDILYAIAHLRDGKVAAFSGRNDLQGRWLEDLISQRALEASSKMVQHITFPLTKEPAYDVAIPVYISEVSQKWGVIRLGFL